MKARFSGILWMVAASVVVTMALWASSLPSGQHGGSYTATGSVSGANCVEVGVEGGGGLTVNRVIITYSNGTSKQLKKPDDYQVVNSGSSKPEINFTDPQTGTLTVNGSTSNQDPGAASLSSCD